MKTYQAIFMMVVMALLLVAASVQVEPQSSIAANQPWTVQLFKDSQDGVLNLSTAFVGRNNVPILSYGKSGSLGFIYYAYKATSVEPGDCGPDNSWVCLVLGHSGLIPATISEIAYELDVLPYLHDVSWAYSNGSSIYVWEHSFTDNMESWAVSWGEFIQLNKFGGILIGTPSLQMSDGLYRIAVTIRDNTWVPTNKLVYMYFTGINNTSCKDSGSYYQCDIIDQATGYGSLGPPSLQLSPDETTVGIAYYKWDEQLMYAYPHTPSFVVPSNCGPGGNTWRCIPIYQDDDPHTVGKVAKFSWGHGYYDRGIAFTLQVPYYPPNLMHAEYVGSGGNCGRDLSSFGNYVYKWDCTVVNPFILLETGAEPSFSIAIDPQGFSVLSFDFQETSTDPKGLFVAYQKTRVGIPEGGWIKQKIDSGAPGSATGALAALSLNQGGLGFISYIQDEDDQLPDIKIAWQAFMVHLPLVRK